MRILLLFPGFVNSLTSPFIRTISSKEIPFKVLMSHSYNQRTVRDDMWMIIIKIGKWWPKIHSLFIIRIFGNHFRIPPVGLTQSRRKEKGKWESFEPNRRHWTVLGWSLCRFPTVPGSVHPGSPHERRRVVRERSESEGVDGRDCVTIRSGPGNGVPSWMIRGGAGGRLNLPPVKRALAERNDHDEESSLRP